MDINNELQELFKKYRRSTKAAYTRNYPLFYYLLTTTTAFDLYPKVSLRFESDRPKFNRVKWCLVCCKALLEYLYDYEYILMDLKLKLLEQDQSYFKKIATSEESKMVKDKLIRFSENFSYNFIVPEKEWHPGTKKRHSFLKKSDLFKSEYIIREDNHDCHLNVSQDSYLFSTFTEHTNPKNSNTDPRVTNIINRFFNAEDIYDYEESGSLKNERFGKIKRIDEKSQAEISTHINDFFKNDHSMMDKWVIHVLEDMISIYLYDALVSDVRNQLDTGIKYRPLFLHAPGPSEAVEIYAEMFLEDSYNVYTTNDLLKKLHAMVLDYDYKRFNWKSLRTAVYRKGYNL